MGVGIEKRGYTYTLGLLMHSQRAAGGARGKLGMCQRDAMQGGGLCAHSCMKPCSSSAQLTVSISKSRMYSVPHCEQRSAKQLPCSSASWLRGTPERTCRLSTFWLQMYCSLPDCVRASRACSAGR